MLSKFQLLKRYRYKIVDSNGRIIERYRTKGSAVQEKPKLEKIYCRGDKLSIEVI